MLTANTSNRYGSPPQSTSAQREEYLLSQSSEALFSRARGGGQAGRVPSWAVVNRPYVPLGAEAWTHAETLPHGGQRLHDPL